MKAVTGLIWRDGKFWVAEIPGTDIVTQGTSYRNAQWMLADAVLSLLDRKDISIRALSLGAPRVALTCNKPRVLTAFIKTRRLPATEKRGGK